MSELSGEKRIKPVAANPLLKFEEDEAYLWTAEYIDIKTTLLLKKKKKKTKHRKGSVQESRIFATYIETRVLCMGHYLYPRF